MSKTIKFFTIAAISSVLAVSAIAAEEHSGFLGDYSQLKMEKDVNGEDAFRYFNPNLKSGSYQKVLIDATQFYPAPKPTSKVGEQALNVIRNYTDKFLRENLGKKFTLVHEPGPGVIRIRPAITGVDTKRQGLKPYEILPVGLTISRGIVGKPKESTLELEIEAVDSATGERLGAVVRKGVGAKLEGKDPQLSLDHVQPLLDKWINAGANFLAEHVK